MTSYEIEQSLVHLAKQIIKTFGEEDVIGELKQKPDKPYIKDEFFKDMIKKWYSQNKIEGGLSSYGGEHWIGLLGEDEYGSTWKIELRTENMSPLKSNEIYTITELIG